MKIKFLIDYKNYCKGDIITVEKFYTENEYDVDLLRYLDKQGYILYI